MRLGFAFCGFWSYYACNTAFFYSCAKINEAILFK